MTLTTTAEVNAILPFNTRTARQRAGMTQELFAAHIGIKRCSCAAYEEGRTNPSIKVCLAICALAGVTLHEFLTTQIEQHE